MIRVDNSTGIVDVVPVYTGHVPMDQAVTRYFLAHYILVCERFNIVTAESDYEECGAFNTAQRNQAWYTLWSSNNPRSPLNVHKDGSSARVEVESVSFFKRSNGVEGRGDPGPRRRSRRPSVLVEDAHPGPGAMCSRQRGTRSVAMGMASAGMKSS